MHKLTLGQYKDLKLVGPAMFSDTDLEKAVVESIINTANSWGKTNLPIERGDKIVIEVEAKAGDMIVPELSNSNLNYAVGDPSLLPQFENAVGHKQGDNFTMEIAFGDRAPVERLINQTVICHATIKDVTHSLPTNVDDELVQKLDPSLKTVNDLKKRFAVIIRNNAIDSMREQNANQVLDAILAGCDCAYDEDEFTTLYEQVVNQTRTMLLNSKLPDIEKTMNGIASDEFFLSDCRNLTERTIKEELAIKEIIARENITVLPEEVTDNKAQFTQTEADRAEFNAYFPTEEAFYDFLLKEKTVDMLIAWNIVAPGEGDTAAQPQA